MVRPLCAALGVVLVLGCSDGNETQLKRDNAALKNRLQVAEGLIASAQEDADTAKSKAADYASRMRRASEMLAQVEADDARMKRQNAKLKGALNTLKVNAAEAPNRFDEQFARLDPARQLEVNVIVKKAKDGKLVYAEARRLEDLIPGNRISADFFEQQGSKSSPLANELADGVDGTRNERPAGGSTPSPVQIVYKPVNVPERLWREAWAQSIAERIARLSEAESKKVDALMKQKQLTLAEVDELENLIGPTPTSVRSRDELAKTPAKAAD